MAKKADKVIEKQEESIEERELNPIEKKLMALYSLQKIDSQIDKIRVIRGELPLEVQDLEDEIVGLGTRVEKYEGEIQDVSAAISDRENQIKESEELIAKYKDQQMNIRNNREYDSISKELEFQGLEIQLSEKRIREGKQQKEAKQIEVDKAKRQLEERQKDLDAKKNELDEIISETEKEEGEIMNRSKVHEEQIEERLLAAYKRIRGNARNGLAVVPVERDACGGCFSKIPPQRQLDIKSSKKIIVCEYCGRILVDDSIVDAVELEY
ncbi:MAG: C4-type zinc ribbon domain-containing protein [Bacteroidota bacterium]|nr:C4-type zinc ribbon domain-containing protein [Bacteroidota bacterium]